jgi:hypothetical protein
MITKRLSLTGILAAAAAVVAVAAPAGASAAEKPSNYGACISQAAMFDEDPVREWTQFYSPVVVIGDRFISPPVGGEVGLACGPEG